LPAGKKRTICRNAVRKLEQLSPFMFRQFLLHKAREHGTRVIICDEHYTSKTCTCCGMLNHGLGASKTFVCPTCSAVYDRDAGAARNILLRYIS
jgi:putative transposase